jgi:hypothetical protein
MKKSDTIEGYVISRSCGGFSISRRGYSHEPINFHANTFKEAVFFLQKLFNAEQAEL